MHSMLQTSVERDNFIQLCGCLAVTSDSQTILGKTSMTSLAINIANEIRKETVNKV